MTLRELVDRYRALAGGYGRPVHLSEFGLAQEETEREFSAYEEDYQIGRFLQFTRVPDAENYPRTGAPSLCRHTVKLERCVARPSGVPRGTPRASSATSASAAAT